MRLHEPEGVSWVPQCMPPGSHLAAAMSEYTVARQLQLLYVHSAASSLKEPLHSSM